jgi:hypothetical protein
MIQEYALDPEMLANEFPGKAHFFREAFGPDSIRFLSRFPKRWMDDLKGAFKRSEHSDDVLTQKAIFEFAKRLQERAIKRHHGQLAAGNWLAKAEHEHSHNPFHAILANENPNGNVAVIPLKNVHEHPKWDAPRECYPMRTATALASIVEPLLIRAPDVIFVDPYFDIRTDEYYPAFREYFRRVGGNIVTSKPKLTIITGLKKVWERGVREPSEENVADFVTDCKELFPRMVPNGCTVTIAVLKEIRGGQQFHNRYVLTKHAAIKFQTGLGCLADNTGSKDDLSLHTYTAGESLWELYNLQRQPPAFENVIEPFIIQT